MNTETKKPATKQCEYPGCEREIDRRSRLCVTHHAIRIGQGTRFTTETGRAARMMPVKESAH